MGLMLLKVRIETRSNIRSTLCKDKTGLIWVRCRSDCFILIGEVADEFLRLVFKRQYAALV